MKLRKLFAHWFFVFAAINTYIASLIHEEDTAAMLVWFYKDTVSSAKDALSKS